jgi:membrane-associated protease RseP (regulator of RpoE activity)
MNKRFVTVAALLMLGHGAFAANLQLGSGARVDGVDADGAAANAGIKPGDLILAIDGKPINGYTDIDPVVSASGKRTLAIDISRGATHLRVKLTPRVSTEPTGPRKLLGISHADAVAAPERKRPNDLWHIFIDPPQGLAPEPERKGPNDLWHIFVERPPEQPQGAAPISEPERKGPNDLWHIFVDKTPYQ